MRKLMWLLSAMALGAPDVQAQFGQPYDPWSGGSPGRGLYAPGANGRRDLFGPRTSAVSLIPDIGDPFCPFRSPVSPVGWRPWQPPTLQNILNQHGIGEPIFGRPFDPLSNLDPLYPQSLIHGPINGLEFNLPIPGVRIDTIIPSAIPPHIEPFHLDPKVFESPESLSRLRDFEANAPTRPGGEGLPEWLCWKCAAGVFILAMLARLLHALMGSKISKSQIGD